MHADESCGGMCWLDAVDVVFLLVSQNERKTASHAVYAVHGGHGLNQELIGDWLIRMRLCKQTPHGPCDVIWFGEILGDTPFKYINRADGLNQ